MEYRKEETLYGPEMRFNDWQPETGKTDRAGGELGLIGEPICTVIRSDYPYGGGGDVELSVEFTVEPVILPIKSKVEGDEPSSTGSSVGGEPCVVVHFNYIAGEEARRGERATFTAREVRLEVAGETVAAIAHRGLGRDEIHRVRLATLDERYAVWYGDTLLASGTMPEPYVDNEGKVLLSAMGSRVWVRSFEECTIAHDVTPSAWERGELLYREEFDPATFDRFWLCNRDGEAELPEHQRGRYVFRHMSNNLLRERFDGPLAIDITATPVPNPEFTSGVTDAIFLWMADAPENDLMAILEEKNREGIAGLPMLMPYRFYWVDFGGSNNVTTRLRKNPHRHMMRQYTDGKRLLRRNHTYRICCVQNHNFIEFHVDGDPMIKVFDPHPITSGHVGIRCFVADLEVTNYSVYRIRS